MAGAEPLYGTWIMSSFAVDLNSSLVRCCGVPLPADAYWILPFCELT